MTGLGLAKAVELGAIQGITEFLPISSSGHLALAQRLLGLDPNHPEMLLFDVVVHVGTVVAVIIVFFRPIRLFLRRLRRELSSRWTRPRYACRIVMLAVAATIPTGVIGLTLQHRIESAFDSPLCVGICLMITGSLLAALRGVPRGKRGWRRFYWWQAILVGLAQSMALLPGISRSGSTICTALFCGLRRRWAGEFSFLIAMPAILGATLLKVKDMFSLPEAQLAAVHWWSLWVGGFVALVVGALALKLLLGALRRAKLHYFAPYCLLLGLAVLLTLR